MLTTYPATIPVATVSARGTKSFFARPASSTTGNRTAIVARVAASAAIATAFAPLSAAATRVLPGEFRWIDSSTTTEMSTSGPIDRVRPPSVNALRLCPVT